MVPCQPIENGWGKPEHLWLLPHSQLRHVFMCLDADYLVPVLEVALWWLPVSCSCPSHNTFHSPYLFPSVLSNGWISHSGSYIIREMNSWIKLLGYGYFRVRAVAIMPIFSSAACWSWNHDTAQFDWIRSCPLWRSSASFQDALNWVFIRWETPRICPSLGHTNWSTRFPDVLGEYNALPSRLLWLTIPLVKDSSLSGSNT